ncbi:hypothetical protein G7061_01200 [Erysipelothrix sp. HDW6B]|uniref:hypothetical protein n=1 Tax=Erysipelothrix TaxID=1647 RepID=UPI00135BDD5C|nr:MULTISPECIES: hypothetical protein [Erysipelothrix]QIK85314.1 hypothetical protein G7061_01200 [Erysipelothrix sp. HDW6B]
MDRVTFYNYMSTAGYLIFMACIAVMISAYGDRLKGKDEKDEALLKRSKIKFIVAPIVMVGYVVLLFAIFG